MDAVQRGRVNKRDFVKGVAARSGVSVRTADAVYNAIIAEIFDAVEDGKRLTLRGFGKFFVQTHKGHRVTKIDDNGNALDLGTIADYPVLKFSSTRTVNRLIGERAQARAVSPEVA